MVTVTSLYICISYIYTYSYNFYYLSSLHSYCMSIFSVTCSMSLAYLLSILLLYSYLYTLHIPYSFYNLLLFISYHYFSDYVNFYHIFHISLRSAELYFTIISYIVIGFHIYFHVLSYTIVFIYLSLLYTFCTFHVFIFHALSYLIYLSYHLVLYFLFLYLYTIIA